MKKVQLLLMLNMCLRAVVAYLRVIKAHLKAVPGYSNPGCMYGMLAIEAPQPVSPFDYRRTLKQLLAIAGYAGHNSPPN